MPMYEFECLACGHVFDELVSSMDKRDEAVECPACKSQKTQRKMSTFTVAAKGGRGDLPGRSGGHSHGGGCGCGCSSRGCAVKR